MSINVQLHEDVVPYLVSPYEHFFFLLHHVKLTVESGKYVACVSGIATGLMHPPSLPPVTFGCCLDV